MAEPFADLPRLALSPTDRMIFDCYVVGGASARILADEIGKPMQYIYFRGAQLARRYGVQRPRAKHDGPVRRRLIAGTFSIPKGPKKRAATIDWDLVKELQDEGATPGEISEFLNTTDAIILRGQPRTAGPR